MVYKTLCYSLISILKHIKHNFGKKNFLLCCNILSHDFVKFRNQENKDNSSFTFLFSELCQLPNRFKKMTLFSEYNIQVQCT